MNTARTILVLIRGPAALLGFGAILLEFAMPGAVSRWLSFPALALASIAVAALGAVLAAAEAEKHSVVKRILFLVLIGAAAGLLVLKTAGYGPRFIIFVVFATVVVAYIIGGENYQPPPPPPSKRSGTDV